MASLLGFAQLSLDLVPPAVPKHAVRFQLADLLFEVLTAAGVLCFKRTAPLFEAGDLVAKLLHIGVILLPDVRSSGVSVGGVRAGSRRQRHKPHARIGRARSGLRQRQRDVQLDGSNLNAIAVGQRRLGDDRLAVKHHRLGRGELSQPHSLRPAHDLADDRREICSR